MLQRLRAIAIGVELPSAEGLGSPEAQAVAKQLKDFNGSVWVINMDIVKPLPPKQDGIAEGADGSDGSGQKAARTLHAMWHIEKIMDETRAGAALTPDYLVLVVVASLLAGVGLIENNTVVIVASMPVVIPQRTFLD